MMNTMKDEMEGIPFVYEPVNIKNIPIKYMYVNHDNSIVRISNYGEVWDIDPWTEHRLHSEPNANVIDKEGYHCVIIAKEYVKLRELMEKSWTSNKTKILFTHKSVKRK